MWVFIIIFLMVVVVIFAKKYKENSKTKSIFMYNFNNALNTKNQILENFQNGMYAVAQGEENIDTDEFILAAGKLEDFKDNPIGLYNGNETDESFKVINRYYQSFKKCNICGKNFFSLKKNICSNECVNKEVDNAREENDLIKYFKEYFQEKLTRVRSFDVAVSGARGWTQTWPRIWEGMEFKIRTDIGVKVVEINIFHENHNLNFSTLNRWRLFMDEEQISEKKEEIRDYILKEGEICLRNYSGKLSSPYTGVVSIFKSK